MGYYLISTSDYTGSTTNHLSFTKGTRIEFIEKVEGGMIRGRIEGRVGLFPSALITIETRPLSVITNSKLDLSKQHVNSQQTTPSPLGSSSSDTVLNTNGSSPNLNGVGSLSGSSGGEVTPSLTSNTSLGGSSSSIPLTETVVITVPVTTTTTTTTIDTNNNNNNDDLNSNTSSNNSPTNSTINLPNGANLSSSFDNLRVTGIEKKKHRDDEPVKTNLGLFRKSRSGTKRRYANRKKCPRLTISRYEDLPDDIKLDLRHEDVPLAEIRKHIKVFLTILKFLTRQKITYLCPEPKSKEVVTTTTDKKNIEIQTSSMDIDQLDLDNISDSDEKKKKKLEVKLERKRALTGTTPEFIAHASTLVKIIPDIKKRIKIGNLIGKGGYGKVFEAHWDKKKVAIKVVHYRTPKEQHNVLIELGFLSKCHHPNIVEFRGAVMHDEQMFLVTEFMTGGSLETAVSSTHVFKETHIGYIAKEILKGIEYLHQNKMVHRDIKSGNIMISLEGDIKLVDFGLCTSVENGDNYHMVGSPYWMPPEMLKGENHSFPADIWSFGICVLEMMFKKPPHRESRFKAMFVNATQGVDVTKFKCSLDLKDLLWQCFEMDPKKRSSANKLLRHPFFQRAETKQGMKGLFDNMFLQRNLNSTGFF